MTTQCKGKTALLMAYTHAAKIYYEAVMALSKPDIRSKSESRKLHDLAEKRRQQVETARKALDLHIGKHNC